MDYLNPNSSFNNKLFNKQEFFNIVEHMLRRYEVPVDDFKGNISCHEDIFEGDEAFTVRCKFSWIVYPEDGISDYRALAEEVEDIFYQLVDDCECVYYNDSEYSEEGKDFELRIYTEYNLEPYNN